ncbi:unannotated protein [freshwater metagenome]|uniref:Unannotated protein n=1 Tax=freshwater metagenome TaxID=449393 RepID=A0A6J6BRA6_9ZZZZ
MIDSSPLHATVCATPWPNSTGPELMFMFAASVEPIPIDAAIKPTPITARSLLDFFGEKPPPDERFNISI